MFAVSIWISIKLGAQNISPDDRTPQTQMTDSDNGEQEREGDGEKTNDPQGPYLPIDSPFSIAEILFASLLWTNSTHLKTREKISTSHPKDSLGQPETTAEEEKCRQNPQKRERKRNVDKNQQKRHSTKPQCSPFCKVLAAVTPGTLPPYPCSRVCYEYHPHQCPQIEWGLTQQLVR